MVRIAGVDVPDRKKAHVALRRIYGIGPTLAAEILVKAGIDPVLPPRMSELSEAQVDRIRELVDREYMAEGDLRRDVNQNIRRLIEIGSYRGLRHRRGLPAHGQRTRTNARTRKGPRRTWPAAAAAPGARSRWSNLMPRPRSRRRERRSVPHGRAYIYSTFNNTLVSIADPQGNIIASASAGTVGFKGSRKGTAFAAQRAAEQVARRGMDHGLREIDVMIKGPGAGREAAIRSLQGAGLVVTSIRDVTPIPHNGCRPPKRRRV